MNRLVRMIVVKFPRIIGKYFKLRRHAKHPERYTEQERWDNLKALMAQLIDGGNLDLVVTGLENIPKEGGFMLYGNHQGLFDVIAIAATCPRPLGVVYKKELSNTPVLKLIYKSTKSFAMDREDVRQSLTVINQVTEEVKNGRNYLIFPEGTRSKKGNEMLDFHGGSFRCAVKAKCPVVPLALVDCFKVLDQKGSGHLRVQIHYLPAILPEEFEGLKAAQLADMVKNRIRDCIKENI